MTTTRRTLDRKPCPRCGRDIAWRVVRGPRVNRGRPIPALKQPVPHKTGLDELAPWCTPKRGDR
jgi:hypothetical protein